MLAIFETQLSSIDTELLTLQSRLTELENLKNDLQAKQAKAFDVLSSLKTLAAELGSDAIANLKSAVLGIFGDTASENGSNAPQTEIFTNFVTEIPKMPTVEEIFDAECLPPTDPETVPAGSLITISTGDGGSVSWVVPEEKPFAELVALNSTLAYQRKHDGEIICAYLGCSTQKLAKDWAELLTLRGHDSEVRKAKRLSGDDIKWEVKIKAIPLDALQRLSTQHPSPFEPAIDPEKKHGNPNAAEPMPNSTPTNGEQAIDDGGTDSIAESSDAASSESGGADMGEPNLAFSDPAETDDFYFVRPSQFDALCPEWDVYLKSGNKCLGRVRRHLTKDSYQHSLLRGIEWQRNDWPSAEEAAIALMRRKEAQQAVHDRANAELRTAAGF